MKALIGKKLLQTELFLTNGVRIPVTKIDVSENIILDIKSVEKHGYEAVQLGYGAKKRSKKSDLERLKKANISNTPFVTKEVATVTDGRIYNIGEKVNVESVLQPGDIVTVTGTSKGKGFAGVVKRHNFRGGPRTHGQSDRERAPGSIGQTTTPGRVYRGKRMAGRMGQEKSSVLNLLVVNIENKGGKSIVVVKGLVPGTVNSFVTINKTGTLSAKKFVSLLEEKSENEKKVDNIDSNTEVKDDNDAQTPQAKVSENAENPKDADQKEQVLEKAASENASDEKEKKE